MTTAKHAIVIGASSGIGAEIVKQLSSSGWKVAAVARREDRLKALPSSVLTFTHDVSNFSEVPNLFLEMTRQLGGLDAVYYCAGVMPEVGEHEFDFAKDKEIVEVNVLGAIAWLNQAAIRFENTRHGVIVGIGSVAGDRGRMGQPVYNMSKAALATYLEALRNRLSRYGVRVVTVKPGPVETEMTASLRLKGAISADAAAAKIIAAADRNGEVYLKFTHRVAFYLIKRVPSWLFRKLKI